MESLIDYHANCGCGADINVTTEVTITTGTEESGIAAGIPLVRTVTRTTGAKYGATGVLPDEVGIALAELHSHEVDAAAVGKAPAPLVGEAWAAAGHPDTAPADLLGAALSYILDRIKSGEATPDGVRLALMLDDEHDADSVDDEAERSADDDDATPDHTTAAPPIAPAGSQRPKRPTPARGGGG